MESTDNLSGICILILEGGKQRENALRKLYADERIRKSISKIVLEDGGDFHNATDVYQEAIILFDRKIRENQFQGKSQISTFIIGLGKNIWRNMRRRKSRMTYIEDHHEIDRVEDSDPERTYIKEEITIYLKKVLKSTGEACHELLRLWKESIPLKKIAKILNYTSYNAVRKKKYRCMKKLLESVENNAQFKHFFNQ